VATPVIEVGIDVPNATVMLVESADRFGLSQLHQFRGRVGRGKEQSYCMLLAENPSQIGRQRLDIIENSQDGFKLAEEDLKLRGPGEFFGTRQSGIPDLKMAKISDVHLLETARRRRCGSSSRTPPCAARNTPFSSASLPAPGRRPGT
jgi:ATP-dependent DNA helicase RecG